MPESRTAIIDGSNIACLERSQAENPKLSNILAVRKSPMERGWEPTVIVDASLRYEIDDRQQLDNLLDDQVIRQAPAGTDADYFIIELAERQDGLILSNDEFDHFQDEHPSVRFRRIPVMIVEGQVVLDDSDIRPDG